MIGYVNGTGKGATYDVDFVGYCGDECEEYVPVERLFQSWEVGDHVDFWSDDLCDWFMAEVEDIICEDGNDRSYGVHCFDVGDYFFDVQPDDLRAIA